ncbi:ABC transporter substrate-binding protein [Conexibacter sp. JD483]|uniref:ABC transporter substrate-binding protein n=1 Tax=unclassified Conexibacter TaxID=2627773 RepID=UPI00271B643C|nr:MULTISPECIES: ABC transporter substrate-binding protein [unclassified Conexibacter]MDO8185304.1 ABC transporter substrate-binding protein [Conexibacter sp. CPCC 205706]MDO8198350.1 ABC transporter substrate-binding protein [Conexibacter sp. CPCC 205762]MDR9370537.1 ABC transporter substrate-binding protein [Conexibacter sp. JD483]
MRPRVPTVPLLSAAAALAVALPLAACGDDSPSATAASTGASTTTTAAATTYPVVLRNCAREVRVEQAPERVVSVNQPATELLLTLGLADRMVGSVSWNDPVAPALAAANARVPVLSRDFASFERVLKTEPDFVYATFDYSFTDEGVAPRDRFEQLGVATYQSSSECGGQTAQQDAALTIDDMFAEIGDLAQIFGIEQRGAQLVESLRARLARAAGGLDASDVSLAWWYSATKAPYIAGCCGAPGIVTRAVGARNAFEDNRQLWPEIGWESLLERDPDVLVLADLTRGDDGDSAEAKIRFLESDPVAKRLTAVRERRWIVLAGSDMDPGLRNVDAVETVADGLRRLGLAGR